MELKTPLYQHHVDLGAKMVPFAGYSMPVQYPSGVIAEHMAVRTAAGLFDVSHMGELLLTGAGVLPFLQLLLTNNMDGMQDGDCRYSPMCNAEGGVVDDLIVYRLSETSYLLVVNASNKQKDVDWITSYLPNDVTMEDQSDMTSELALQGPNSVAIISRLADAALLPQKGYTFVHSLQVAGIDCLVSRTGYTGEDGFELYCKNEDAAALWEALLAAGQEYGLIACGLGARDTLRLEAGMPLYGQEMSDVITPKEANLGFFVKMDKPNFIGKEALENAGEPKCRRSGLKLTGRGIAREGAEVYKGDKQIGVVTSGTKLPFVDYAGAMALLDSDAREIGSTVEIDVRGRRIEAEVIKLPFYHRAK